MPPEQVDVNVHPTKREVHFLNEEEIIAKVQEQVVAALKGSNASRTFLTQSTIAQAVSQSVTKKVDLGEEESEDDESELAEPRSSRREVSSEVRPDAADLTPSDQSAKEPAKNKRILSQKQSYRPNKMIRTDSKCQAGKTRLKPRTHACSKYNQLL